MFSPAFKWSVIVHSSFQSENNLEPFLYVELNIHNNYGEPHYTCIYRFRVHGQPRQVVRAPVTDDSEVDVNVVEEKQ